MNLLAKFCGAGLLLVVATLTSNACAQNVHVKSTLGWAEKVRLSPSNIIIHAKLDSGSDYSSMNASNLEQFEKDKEPWVKFTVMNRYGQNFTFERPIRRYAIIKRHGMKSQKRPVIRLGVCVGSVYMEEDINIVDRSKFEFQMLIGRSFMAGNVVIDPAVTFTTEPNCKEAPKS